MKRSEEELKNQIASCIAVGWRKGVDSQGSVKIYSALNPLFFNSDKNIQKIAQEHVDAIADAATPIILQKGTSEKNAEELAAAIKHAAVQERQCKSEEFNLLAENQGVSILKSLAPIKLDDYYQMTLDEDSLRLNRYNSKTNTYDPGHRVEDQAQTLAGAVILKFIEMEPSLKLKFQDFLINPEPALRAKLTEAAKSLTDDDWQCMAAWILYCVSAS